MCAAGPVGPQGGAARNRYVDMLYDKEGLVNEIRYVGKLLARTTRARRGWNTTHAIKARAVVRLHCICPSAVDGIG